MWIIPKTLSAFVPATPGWSLESSERAWMFAQSVTWRSKFMSKQYWLKRFKKGDYVQHLSGLTLSPSMHDHFVESWTESQEASHVSHFQAPENEKDKKTQGTYGQASQTLFDFADLDGSSSKTCQDWLPLGCVTSCKTWDKWVTERRGAYSVRKKLALLTKGNESSSWGTPKEQDSRAASWDRGKSNLGEQVHGMTKSWATPQASDHIEGARTAKESNQKCLGRDLNQMNWPTPRAGNPGSRKPGTGGKILAEEAKIHNGLQDQEKSNTSGKNQESWPTPNQRDHMGSRRKLNKKGENVSSKGTKFGLCMNQAVALQEKSNQGSPKLNPNWVESLMLGRGMTGWTQLPTEWTDLGSWGMELSPRPQN